LKAKSNANLLATGSLTKEFQRSLHLQVGEQSLGGTIELPPTLPKQLPRRQIQHFRESSRLVIGVDGCFSPFFWN
jgi:hypothetical protein